MKFRKKKTWLQDFWSKIEIEIVDDPLPNPNKRIPEFERRKMEQFREDIKKPGLPDHFYEGFRK